MQFIKIEGALRETLVHMGYLSSDMIANICKPVTDDPQAAVVRDDPLADVVRDIGRSPFLCLNDHKRYTDFQSSWDRPRFDPADYYQGQMTAKLSPLQMLDRFFSSDPPTYNLCLMASHRGAFEPETLYVSIESDEVSYTVLAPTGVRVDGRIKLSELRGFQISEGGDVLESLKGSIYDICEITARRGHTLSHVSRFLINGKQPTHEQIYDSERGYRADKNQGLVSFAYFDDDDNHLCGFTIRYSTLDPTLWAVSTCSDTNCDPNHQDIKTFCREDMIGQLQTPAEIGVLVNDADIFNVILAEIRSESIKTLLREARIIDEKGVVNVIMLRCLSHHIKPAGDVNVIELRADVARLNAILKEYDNQRRIAKEMQVSSYNSAREHQLTQSVFRRNLGALTSTGLAVGAVVAVALTLTGFLMPLGIAVAGVVALVALARIVQNERALTQYKAERAYADSSYKEIITDIENHQAEAVNNVFEEMRNRDREEESVVSISAVSTIEASSGAAYHRPPPAPVRVSREGIFADHPESKTTEDHVVEENLDEAHPARPSTPAG